MITSHYIMTKTIALYVFIKEKCKSIQVCNLLNKLHPNDCLKSDPIVYNMSAFTAHQRSTLVTVGIYTLLWLR